MKKSINVRVIETKKIKFATLKRYYDVNTLKESKGRDVSGLKTAILKSGFSMPLFVWEKGRYIIDGAGRMLALSMLEYEGYKIPDIPCVFVDAQNLSDAKMLVLEASSKYGSSSNDSLVSFLGDDIKLADLGFISIDEIVPEKIDWKPKGLETEKKKSTTIFKKKCPKCGHEFK